MPKRMADPDFDIVVFGATGFVGKILCHYLADQYGVDGGLKWAAAGRSRSRLEALRVSLDVDLEILSADAADEDALRRMCGRTRVVISTVGPYALYGEKLVRVCAESGTDYCDLAAEFQWIRRMIACYEPLAAKSGARIVHCCGFDSIPSDMGVWFVQRHALTEFAEPCARIKMRVKALRGEFAGTTIASMINLFKEVAADPALRAELADPYSLCPEGHPFRAPQHRVTTAERDADFAGWVAPFVMAAVNTRIVHRSNALSGNTYGDSFRYQEGLMTGRSTKGRARALAIAAGTHVFLRAAMHRSTRWVLQRFIAPAPGEGPSPQARARGYFDLRFAGTTVGGQAVFAKVTGDMDPGYGSTSKILGQAGACLTQDIDNRRGGFWTPATLFGEPLLQRLHEHAGLTFELLDSPLG